MRQQNASPAKKNTVPHVRERRTNFGRLITLRAGCLFGAFAVCATAVGASPSDLCVTAARQVAAESGVPLSVLLAISRLETGRGQDGSVQPWPWTINLEGQGTWFDTEQEALSFARAALAENRTSFDTGCFQINFRWHNSEFDSLEAMFDPLTNARYAARFLGDLFREKGDWSLAAGAYHSRTEAHASTYRARFDELRLAAENEAEVGGFAIRVAQTSSATSQRENQFPLLIGATGGRSLGSLVPLAGGG